MTKTRRVLDKQPRLFNYVQFEQQDVDHLLEWSTQVRLTDQDWRELGEPDQITVTIEPGDLLNVEHADG